MNRMRMTWVLIGMLMLGSALVLAPAEESASEQPADDKKLVEVPNKENLTFLVDGADGLRLRIPIVRKKAELLDAELYDIRFLGNGAEVDRSKFHVEVQPDLAVEFGTIVITTTSNVAEVPPGKYDAIVKLKRRDGTGKPEFLSLVLLNTLPTLAEISTVVVRQIKPFPWNDAVETVPGELRLRESSRRTNLADIQLTAVRNQVDSKPTPAALAFLDVPAVIPAGMAATVMVNTNGSFPLGTSKGKIEIEARDLDAAKSVEYEVRARLHLLWILAVSIVGTVTAFILRVHLPRKREQLAAHLEVSYAMGKALELWNLVEDVEWRQKFAEQASLLDTLLDQKQAPSVLLAAVQKTQEALQKLKAEFDGKLREESDNLRRVHEMLHSGWGLPPSAQEKLGSARNALTAIEAHLARNNVQAARIAREALWRAPDSQVLALINAAIRWHREAVSYWRDLRLDSPPMDKAHLEELSQFAKKLEDAAPKGPAVNTNLDEATGFLKGANDRFQHVEKDMQLLETACAVFLDDAVRRLMPENATPEQTEAEKQLRERTRQLMSNIEAGISVGTASIKRPQEVAAEFQTEWIRFIKACNRIPGLEKSEVINNIRARMKGESWTDAIKMGLPPEKPTNREAVQGLDKPTRVPEWQSAEILVERGNAPEYHYSVREQARLRDRIASINWIQTLVVGILFVIGVYFFYMEAFVGTYKELTTIALLAFSADLTADGLLKALK